MKRFGSIFYYMVFCNLLFFLGNSFFTLLPVFLKDLEATESFIGIVNNIDKLITILGSLGLGWFINKWDRLPLLRFGYIILALAYGSYLLISDLSLWILLIRIVHGIGFSIAFIVGTTIIFDVIPAEHAMEGIGLYGVSGAISNAISPTVGEALLHSGAPFYILFVIATLFMGGSILLTFFMQRIPYPLKTKELAISKGGSLQLLKDKQYLFFALVVLIFGGGFGIIITFLPNYVQSATELNYSYFFIFYTSILILLRFTFIRMVSGFNILTLLILVYLNGGVMFWLLAQLNALYLLIIIGIMYGITHGVLYPVLNSYLVNLASEKDRGKSNAMFSTSFSTGVLVFAFGMGFLIDYCHTYQIAFYIAGGAFFAVALALTGYQLLMNHKTSSPLEESKLD